MHPNICSFAKGLLETVLGGQYEAIILTTCCDSIRRVYDILKEKLPNTFVYILDTPRIIKDAGICLYEKRIREMIEAYEQFSGKKYDDEKLEKVLDMLRFKCWYYEQAMEDGDEERLKSLLPDKLPEGIQEAYDRAHEGQ